MTATQTPPAPTHVLDPARVPGPDRYDCAKPCRSCVRTHRGDVLSRGDYHFAVSERRRLIAAGAVALGVVVLVATVAARKGGQP